MKKSKWERLHFGHNNWDQNFGPEVEQVWGLHWKNDPWHFTHRALVGQDVLGVCHLKVWFITRSEASQYDIDGRGEFIDQGEYPTKLAAMKAGRNIAKMAHAINPEPPRYDDE